MEQLEKITDRQLAENGIVSLADRPNRPSTYGEGGLSAQQLKARFDRLSGLINGKINKLIDILGGETVDGNIGTKYIAFPLGDITSLYEFIQSINGSRFGGKNLAEMLQVSTSATSGVMTSLQTHLNNIVQDISDEDGDIDDIRQEISAINGELDILNGWHSFYDSYVEWLAGNKDVIQMKIDNGILGVSSKSVVEAINKNYEDISTINTQIQTITTNVTSAMTIAEQALEIAQGASRGGSFEDYDEMVETLIDASSTEYKSGDVFLIATVNVPDCYVYKVYSQPSTYTYSTDEQFIEDMANGDAVCGYYDIRQLETAKVDLGEYQKKNDNALLTTDKTVVGAINEVKNSIATTNSVVSSVINDINGVKAKIPSSASSSNQLVAHSELPLVEQIYSPSSTNAQSGVAVAQAVASTKLNIQSSTDTQVDGFDTPLLTATQVTSAYNQLVSGGACTITNAEGEVTFVVQLGDASTGSPSIMIPHYWLGFVDYQVSGNSVNITAHKIPDPNYTIQSVTIGTETIDLILA